jgi:hypothetical protein
VLCSILAKNRLIFATAGSLLKSYFFVRRHRPQSVKRGA